MIRRFRLAIGTLTVAANGLALGFTAVATAQRPSEGQAPKFQVDPWWPKPLPNNWLFGQVANVAVDSNDHVWVLQRPRTLTDDEKGATLKPPRNKCCAPAPSVMEFDADGGYVQGWGFPDTKPWVENEHGIWVDRAGQNSIVVASGANRAKPSRPRFDRAQMARRRHPRSRHPGSHGGD